MTRDDIIRMAREACFTLQRDEYLLTEMLERFAALVVAAKDAEHQRTLALQQRSYEREIRLEVEAEREACAEECDKVAEQMLDEGEGPTGYVAWVTDCAKAIRERGEK